MSLYLPPAPPKGTNGRSSFRSDEHTNEAPNEDLQPAILIFPSRAPSVTRTLSVAPELRRGSTTLSIPSSLVSSVERQSPQISTPSDSGWGESDSDPRPTLGCALPPQPLTREWVAQLQTSESGAANWRGRKNENPTLTDDNVEVWEWTASSPSEQPPGTSLHAPSTQLSSLLQGRRPLPRHGSFHDIEASSSSSSELHFFTPDDSDDDFNSIIIGALSPSRHLTRQRAQAVGRDKEVGGPDLRAIYNTPLGIFGNDDYSEDEKLAAVSYYSPKLLRLPFESVLRFLFDLDPSTLRLLKQENARPHPDNPFNGPPSELFASAINSEFGQQDLEVVVSGRSRASLASLAETSERPGSLGGYPTPTSSIKRGLETLNHFSEAPMLPHSLLVGVVRLPALLVKAVFRL